MKLTKEVAEKIFSAKDYEEAKKQAAEFGYEMTEKEDAALKQHFTNELSDEELDQVAGGYVRYLTNRRVLSNCYAYDYYVFEGDNEDLKYLCPNCHRPVHKGKWFRFYCDPCDESWYFDDRLEPNLANWKYEGVQKFWSDQGTGAKLGDW